jgi:hypothetical protein
MVMFWATFAETFFHIFTCVSTTNIRILDSVESALPGALVEVMNPHISM